MKFVPLSVRRGIREPFEFADGIPHHIKSQLLTWVMVDYETQYGDAREDNVDTAIAVLQWPVSEPHAHMRLRRMRGIIEDDDDAFLDLLDLTCRATRADRRDALDAILELGMSTWRVSKAAPFGLEERLTAEVREVVKRAAGPSDRAAEEIATAWSKAFGRNRDATAAWHAAVKAIEHLLHPIVEPNHKTATRGSMAAALRTKPEKWTFEVSTKDGDRSARPFLAALDLVGYEPGRHGTDPERASIEQARVVVLQALTIVEWLRAGALKRADDA